jgi:4'-phosphopantetheinyl transferase EntD
VESAPSPELVVDAARAILDPEVVVEAAAPAGDLADLFPEEQRYMSSSSSAWAPGRQREFATARACARRALARLGVAPAALVPHADRSPGWPDGIIGSITHTHDLCLVAVARRGRLASLGIDVERVTAASTDIEELVCTPAERRWLDAQPAAQRGPHVRLFFSAKEAFYKCQYPLTRTYLDFQNVELAIGSDGAFGAQIVGVAHAALNHDLTAVRGRWARLEGLVIATAELRSRGTSSPPPSQAAKRR